MKARNLLILLIVSGFVAYSCSEKEQEVRDVEQEKIDETAQKEGEKGEDNENQDEAGFVYVKNGRFYEPTGEELCRWGINFRPCSKWEYVEYKLAAAGVKETSEDLKSVTDNGLADFEKMEVSLIRANLSANDFTDADGHVVETLYLDVLDYMIAEAKKKGMYVALTFLNPMNKAYCSNSCFKDVEKKDLLYDKVLMEKSKTYIREFLQRTNKYTGCKYAEDPAIAYWLIYNEPVPYDYNQTVASPLASETYNEWLVSNKKEHDAENFAAFRKQLVKSYIEVMYDVIRDAGARQPITWSFNWGKFHKTHPEVFEAVEETKIDAVCFCNYPGQDIVGQAYWNNPQNLFDVDFSGWFNNLLNEDGYGWATRPPYSSVAKYVYEFEIFFNQSAYLYPIQALYFRALGAQTAAMWTYTYSEYADHFAGSHFLNLSCTPRKAVSYVIANRIFNSVPLGTKFVSSCNEQVTEHYVISKSRDLCIFSDESCFMHSGDVTKYCPIRNVSDEVKRIVGIGSSRLVDYDGNGVYILEDNGNELKIYIGPNHKWLLDPWDTKNKTKLVSELDFSTVNTMTIRLKHWTEGSYSVYKTDKGNDTKIADVSALTELKFSAGEYRIVKN